MLLKKGEILAQKPLRQPVEGRRTWPLVIAALPFFGVVAAFGIAPDTVPEPIDLQHVVENIEISVAPAVPEAGARFWREERIQRGDTVASILARLGVDDAEASAYLLQARDVRSLYQLIPGRTVRAVTTRDGRLESLTYVNTDGRRLHVMRGESGFSASEEMPATEQWVMQSSGTIESSLFAATDASGIPEIVALQLAEIFSSDIDFHRDLRRGDRFSVVYEALAADGEFLGFGRVLSAEFVNQGHAFRAVFFHDQQGRNGYYTPDGRNMRKAFLRSPIEFSRVTSGFTTARFHPVLKTWRAHKGIDYGAPPGTRVRSTADGHVKFAGRKGGYGNVVIVRHPNGYETLYAHLSAFAPGLRAGRRVVQGEVVGFVGSTGLVTGPHLHYEFHVNGVHQNPMRLAMPPGPPITADSRASFEESTQPLLARLDMLRDTNLARLD
ncbi:MAG TPA: peptidoglycan DD-metalloendopeptidase family protein [Burkholderiales bacterium]|nr:peptidoglycan DD-metalloendopeptidase family protein [Burkholderiales bacterium]